ncbi:MAG TPA: DUF2188 domain-containing protein [Planctomycetota bacterium]|nr:DUF2188 domain-containing protein [Planctomycetota bacterium]
MAHRMLARDVFHIIPTRANGWEIRHEHKAHPHAEFATKSDAIERARRMAEACDGEMVVHRRDFSEEQRVKFGE